MVEIKPMDERYIHITCLHDGPVDSATWAPSWNVDASELPPHPWSDETIRGLATDCAGISHGNCENPAGQEFFREMIQRYATCAILAWDGQKVVGQIRFYPMNIARLIAVSQTDLSPVLDCTAACEPEEDEGTLWVQCVMTCKPYRDAERAKRVRARKGVGVQLARALIPWAREHGWKRIVKVAHCELDWFYGIQGGGGKAFWEKVGFRVARSFHKRAFELRGEDKAVVQSQMAARGMTEQEVWVWYRMVYEL